MISSDYKIFKDNVHGYIRVPLDYVKLFVDSEMFQRLRYIEQTGMRSLYPSARHDRFIHSLGTFYLGQKAFECLKNNVQNRYKDVDSNKNNYYHVKLDEVENDKFWRRSGMLFEIACLLHDCGHAPFSHTLEFYYEQEQMDPDFVNLKDKLKEYLGSEDFHKDFTDQGTEHERMSALVVCAEYAEAIKELVIANKLQQDDLKDSDGGDDIEFIVRMIIGCGYSRLTKENQIRNCLIDLLNSNTIDVDSLDYIVRDSKQSGIQNMSVDVERLLSSLNLVQITSFDKAVFHDVDIHVNIINGKLEKNDTKQVDIKGRCQGKFLVLGNVRGEMSGELDLKGEMQLKKSVKMKNSSPHRIEVNGAAYQDTIPAMQSMSTMILYGNPEDSIIFSANKIRNQEETNVRVKIEADTAEFEAIYIDGKLNGKFTGEILGDQLSRINGAKVRCRLGYHKSSLGIIQNVVIARNYEYKWIYSHHKVVYTANYLNIELLRMCVSHYLQDLAGQEHTKADNEIAKMLSWERMIKKNKDEIYSYTVGGQSFWRPTDSDITAFYKKCYIDCMEAHKDEECLKILTEYYTRKYKSSLWKSYAEFNVFFNDFSSVEKSSLYKMILEKTKGGIAKKFGYFNEEWEREFNACGLKNVVWVNGNSKLKSLDPDNTYVLFKNDVLTYRTANQGEMMKNKNINLFYLYYEEMGREQIDKEELKDFFKRELNRYMG